MPWPAEDVRLAERSEAMALVGKGPKNDAEPEPETEGDYRRDDFLRDLRKVSRRPERDRDKPSQGSN